MDQKKTKQNFISTKQSDENDFPCSSSWSNTLTLGLLTISYTIGELGHFIIATTSKKVANSLEFGDLRCYASDPHDSNLTSLCTQLSDQDSCENQEECVWCYSGQGWQYQVLAGPGFIVVFTVSGVIMGYCADRISRPRILSVSMFVLSVCMMLSGLASTYSHLLLLRMGVAAGEAAIRPAGGSLIAEIFPPQHRAIANGIFSWGVYLGYGFAFLFGFNITEMDIMGHSWRSAYMLAGLTGVLLSPTLLLIHEPRSAGGQVPPPPPVVPAKLVRKLSYGCMEQGKEITATLTQSPEPTYIKLVLKSFSSPVMMLLFLAASIRHTAGYSWAHNSVSYFHHYHADKQIGSWFMVTAIVGGCIGVFSGGYISDLVVTRLGVHSRLWLLGAATIIATPFAGLTLLFDPPTAFVTLLVYYFFAETWFSLLFTVLVEIVPRSIRSVSIGTFLFLMNNVGGNLPLLVDPLAKTRGMGLQKALYIAWPGLTAASGFMFLLSGLQLWSYTKREDKDVIKSISC